jgi:amidase
LNLDTATALETAAAVRAGKLSALEVCDAAIARIEAKDGPINAVVVRDFERARAQAKAVDASRTKDDARPLLGVAMTVKESNHVAGLPTTWGFPQFKSIPVDEDATCVARLKASGAVILGKTNAPVALADWQTDNPVYGRTSNPHDLTRSPGGSSGGGAAALAGHMVPLEFGSDIGGSIRVPAALCGVCGHKPTYGIIPLRGHTLPGFDTVDVQLAVVGPLARSVADLSAAMEVTAGPLEGVGYRLDLPPARHASLKDYRVLVLEAHPAGATDASVRDPLNELAGALERAGVKITRGAALPDLAGAHGNYVRMLMTITQRGVPDATVMNAHEFMRLQDVQAQLTRHWREVFRDVDVVLAPAFGVVAFPHMDEPDWTKRTIDIDGKVEPYGSLLAWPGLATFPHLPATAVPIARTAAGLPVGAQIMGGPYEDRTTLAFAGLLQREGLAL